MNIAEMKNDAALTMNATSRPNTAVTMPPTDAPMASIADLVERRDARVRQRDRLPRIVAQRFPLRRIVLYAGRRNLDRDGPAEAGVARAKDLAEPAFADTLEDLVVRDAVQTVKIIR